MNCVHGKTLPLHIALHRGHTELALLLIKHGVSLNQRDGHGHLPLQIAVKDGHTEVALSLIKHGAPMNEQDNYLPLHIAVKYGHSALALSLIKHGASVNQASSEGYLPLHHAVSQGLDGKHFNGELFTKLIPGSSMDILKTICKILKQTKPTDKEKEHKMQILSSMLHKLIQHLILCEPLSINIKGDIYCFEISLNQHLIVKSTTLKTVYVQCACDSLGM